jgi:hypothetical protein
MSAPKDPKGSGTASGFLKRYVEATKASRTAPEPPTVAEVETEPAPVMVSPETALSVQRATSQIVERQRKRALQPYKPRRDEHGHFLKGHTGNPYGRPPSLLTYIREMTGGGQEMVDQAIRALRGTYTAVAVDPATGLEVTREMPTDAREQAEARHWLTEHSALVRVAADAVVEAERQPNADRLGAEEFAAYDYVMRVIDGDVPSGSMRVVLLDPTGTGAIPPVSANTQTDRQPGGLSVFEIRLLLALHAKASGRRTPDAWILDDVLAHFDRTVDSSLRGKKASSRDLSPRPGGSTFGLYGR